MERESNLHNTNGNSIMTMETEWSICYNIFLTAVGESSNDTEETLLRNEASLTLNVLDHNEKEKMCPSYNT